ncbi:MAG: HTH domain-containing protein [Nitrososphaera sp.]|uniref:winged helix-turn-helix domain-containing protein n=1 Tax=Nitrososphaera sp. TaxID=1971748 RepID=UPI0017ADD3FC|nr:HTH domain-containing protein [Nitrososphaera sp.]NWG38263.1 HTH domain-containing protein [Nitrososphaera sp.]
MSGQKGEMQVEIETRRAKVMALHSKGITQDEMAKELGVDQATVSRDLQEMRKQSKKVVEQQVTDEALFEFSRWMAGLDQMTRVAWKMAENENSSAIEKLRSLEFLRDCYNARLRMLIGTNDDSNSAQSHVFKMRHESYVYEPDFHFRREKN